MMEYKMMEYKKEDWNIGMMEDWNEEK